MSTSAEKAVAPARLRDHFDLTEKLRAELREAVAAVDSHLGHLPGASTAAKSGLPEAWATLVKLLNLGEEPAVRLCPACGGVGMRAATRCGHCWTALMPEPFVASEREPHGGVTEA